MVDMKGESKVHGENMALRRHLPVGRSDRVNACWATGPYLKAPITGNRPTAAASKIEKVMKAFHAVLHAPLSLMNHYGESEERTTSR